MSASADGAGLDEGLQGPSELAGWYWAGETALSGLVVTAAAYWLGGRLAPNLPGGLEAVADAAWLIAAAVTVVATVVMPILRLRAVRVGVKPLGLVARDGALRRRVSVVPLSRIQAADVHMNPLRQEFEVGRLVVHTAARRAVRVEGIEPELAAQLARRVRPQQPAPPAEGGEP